MVNQKAISARINLDVLSMLIAYSKVYDKPKNAIINEAIKEYIDKRTS